MPIIAKEEQQKHKAIIRQMLTENNGRATIQQIQERINCGNNYALKLKREIDLEDADDIDVGTLGRVLGRISKETQKCLELAEQVEADPEAEYRDKIQARKLANESLYRELEAMFNSGYFKKKLGELDTKNLHLVINLLDIANGTDPATGEKDSIEAETES